MATIPMVADCHVTASSSSATETLKPWRIWSLSERTTCRRSLSDWACSMRISSVNWATGMASRDYTASVRPIPATGSIFSSRQALIRKLRQLRWRGFGSEQADHDHGRDSHGKRQKDGVAVGQDVRKTVLYRLNVPDQGDHRSGADGRHRAPGRDSFGEEGRQHHW